MVVDMDVVTIIVLRIVGLLGDRAEDAIVRGAVNVLDQDRPLKANIVVIQSAVNAK
jgi:hypothetical protein